jgi:hypothetical protein
MELSYYDFLIDKPIIEETWKSQQKKEKKPLINYLKVIWFFNALPLHPWKFDKKIIFSFLFLAWFTKY